MDVLFDRRSERSKRKHTQSRYYGKYSVNRTFTLKKLQHGTKREQKIQTKATRTLCTSCYPDVQSWWQESQRAEDMNLMSYLEYLFGDNDKGTTKLLLYLRQVTELACRWNPECRLVGCLWTEMVSARGICDSDMNQV